MTFLLEPPDRFRGLDPDLPVRVYSCHLPHWRQQGATYFVTFHLADALPAHKLRMLESLRRESTPTDSTAGQSAARHEQAQEAFRQIEQALDAGAGECWFRNSAYAAELRLSLLHFHARRYELGCFVIMANHCHLVIRPHAEHALEDLVGAVKSVTANFVSARENLAGKFWHEESYDRIIRDAEHLYRVVQYIGDNPRRAGSVPQQWQRWINPQWVVAGWNFVDRRG